MPNTRRQTGKLPPKMERLIDAVPDLSITRGNRGRIRYTSQDFSLSKMTKATNSEVIQKEVVQAEVSEVSNDVFQAFTCDANLSAGVCIIRSLDNGKYELINLSLTDHLTLTSEETIRLFREDDGRLDAMTKIRQEWFNVRYKINQAISGATGQIFRFEKLPPELRCRIYEFALVGEDPLKNYKRDTGIVSKALGLGLLETCKWIYNEARSFFYKNSLEIMDIRQFQKLLPILKDNLYNVTFSWWGFRNKDPKTLRFFASCKNLRILNILITRYGINTVNHGRQYSFQNEDSIRKFVTCNGFDALLTLRGLLEVNVRRDAGILYPSFSELSDDEIDSFEDFLSEHLTQPKLEQPPTAPKKSSRQLAKEYKRRKIEEAFINKPRKPARLPRNASASAAALVAQQLAQVNSEDEDDYDDDDDA